MANSIESTDAFTDRSRYEGRKAVVTGGTMGTGLAIARRLVAGGAEVLLTGLPDRHLLRAREELGAHAHVVRSDTTSLDDIAALGATAEEVLGRVDYLFVNAGVAELGPVTEVTEESYDRQFGVNAKGAFFTAQRMIPLLREGGAIVFATSAADSPGAPGTGVHSGSKAAVWAFAQVLAAELAGQGIRVNAVGSCSVDVGEPGGAATPLRRHGSADEAARAALFLATEATFTTGVRLPVDGGPARGAAVLPAC
ncbi:SDR family oxidoreductase [Streptomyces sp. UNOB3_S3]|uniref:SDR family oxidoreductase n=1 Tax=Streptomyces sp. UNOB3_S3 TaxID=2871682 RepID=UPI001E2E254A|nr:SDR family oxidoreductase [Streptomyces sp. UNOB3_S3]MCC3775691.1 SDR family oxidoreductase [Streptomyces sp. UNOB3_S3]